MRLSNSNRGRLNISSDGKYEKEIGYSRAVRTGNMVFVSGTTGVPEKGSFDPQNVSYEQAREAISKIAHVLGKVDCSLKDVVSTRVYLSRNTDWKQVAKAHLEFFGDILPTSSMLVCEFLDPRILVEIEAQAVVQE